MKIIILVLIFSLLYNLNCENSEEHQEPPDDGLDVNLKGNEKDKNSEEHQEPPDDGLDVNLKGNEKDKIKLKSKEEEDDKIKLKIKEEEDDKIKPKNKEEEDDKIKLKNKEEEDDKIKLNSKEEEDDKIKLKNKEEEDDKIDKTLTEVFDYKIHENYDEKKVKGVINHFPGGDLTELFGTNQHYNIPANYQEFGRRFVLQYPYTEKKNAEEEAEDDLHNTVQQYIEDKRNSRELLPIKAPPEFVLDIAKQSAILEASKPINPTDDIIHKDILRSGDYWNDVWKEEIDPKKILRSHNSKNNLESVTVEIQPGSKLYTLISMLKEKSPRLLYVINKDVY